MSQSAQRDFLLTFLDVLCGVYTSLSVRGSNCTIQRLALAQPNKREAKQRSESTNTGVESHRRACSLSPSNRSLSLQLRKMFLREG